MDADVAGYQEAAIAASSKKTYKTGQHHFLRFCRMMRVPPLPVSENNLARFSAFMARTVGYRTIRVYLAGIRMLHLQHGFADPIQSALRLPLVLRGIRRCQDNNHSRSPRLPITAPLMRCLKSSLRWRSTLSRRDKLMIWAAFTSAFFGFLRVSEFTATSDRFFDKTRTLLASDLSFLRDTVVLHLRRSKTDQYGQGRDVTLTSTDNSTCPVRAIRKFWRVRAGTVDSPLFCFQSGAFLTRQETTTQLRSLLSSMGLPSSRFASHSFRIGAASTAASAGIAPNVIQRLGRWSSQCYQSYIRTDVDTIRAAMRQMS